MDSMASFRAHRTDSAPANHPGERGTMLVVALVVLFLLTAFALALLSVTDAEVRQSRSYADSAAALSDTDAAVQEVLYRLNLTPGSGAPPAGSRVTVNDLVAYDARLDADPLGILGNGIDDDASGQVDDVSELAFERDWTVRMTLTRGATTPGAPWEVTDSSPRTGPPYGPSLVVPTIQPRATWRTYTTADPASP